MTTRPPSDSDGWYDPDGTDAGMLRQIHKAGEYRRSDPPAPLSDARFHELLAEAERPPTPVPEGMETTPQSRALILTTRPSDPDGWYDPDPCDPLTPYGNALAEIARLTAINADLCAVNLRHAEAIARLTAEQPSVSPDRERHRVTRAAVLAEREACETVVAKILSDSPPIDRILSAIRARPTP